MLIRVRGLTPSGLFARRSWYRQSSIMDRQSDPLRSEILRKSLVSVSALLACFATIAFAQNTEWVPPKLKADLVQEKGGKMILEHFRVCQVVRPKEAGGGASKPFRVRSHMETATPGFMSRDSFIALATEIGLTLRMGLVGELIKGLTPSQALDALQCRDIDSPVNLAGTADFDVSVIMEKAGLNIEMFDRGSGKRNKQLYPWSQLYPH
jgi:hypothetical protein